MGIIFSIFIMKIPFLNGTRIRGRRNHGTRDRSRGFPSINTHLPRYVTHIPNLRLLAISIFPSASCSSDLEARNSLTWSLLVHLIDLIVVVFAKGTPSLEACRLFSVDWEGTDRQSSSGDRYSIITIHNLTREVEQRGIFAINGRFEPNPNHSQIYYHLKQLTRKMLDHNLTRSPLKKWKERHK